MSQPQAQQPATTRNPQTGFNEVLLERFVGNMEAIYNTGPNSSNPRGLPLRNWTPDDLGVLDTATLSAIRAIISSERYDLVDRLKPQNMSRAEYSRAILREAASRNNGDLEDFYSHRLAAPVASVQVSRPIGVPASSQVRVSADPAILAIHDAAVNILRNPRYAGVVFEPDVAQAMGHPELALAGVTVRTDASTYDLGYTAGATVVMRNGKALPLSIGFVENVDQVHAGYCAVTNDIYARQGRSVDQTEAFSAGFAQARIDARSNFQGQDVPTGLNGACPAQTPPVTDNVRIALAITR